MQAPDLPPRPATNPTPTNTVPAASAQPAAATQQPAAPAQPLSLTQLQQPLPMQPAVAVPTQQSLAASSPDMPMSDTETQTTTVQQSAPGTTQVIVNQTVEQKNNIGLAGFIIALVDLVFSWAPFANWILWLVGLVLSVIGLMKKPKGFAIAGTIISCIDLIIILLIVSAGLAILSSFR